MTTRQGRRRLPARDSALATRPSTSSINLYPNPTLVILPIGGKTYYLYKAFVYVIGSPHARTTVTVEDPKTARLYYTDPDTWATQRSPAAILGAATNRITLEACPGLTRYTGGFVVVSPTCLRLLITSGATRNEARARLGVNVC